MSTSTLALARTTTASSATRSPGAGAEKPATIEQSVRKFRIVEALRNGDTAFISKVIRESDSVRMSTSSSTTTAPANLEDTTILHLAIQCAEHPVLEYILSDGAGSIDVNARDKHGNTPLHVAATQGRAPAVRILLEQPDINDAIQNYAGRMPLDVARTPEIFQQLQLSRSMFIDSKVTEIRQLAKDGNYQALGELLEEPRSKSILDINGGEFASEGQTVASGGTLLHEAARRKNTQLIQVLLLHGADPFRRDHKGKLPQDVTKDDHTRAMLKKSPAAVAAQRCIQEKAVLGNTSAQGANSTGSSTTAGKDAREMKGYLKKWTNYRKGFQLRWFVLEDGVLSYYKHQDDAGSACRGAINMRIAKLHMDPTEKTKFEILGKSSVKYHLKANHEVEAKRWFWALNNSIQWSKDLALEEERQRVKSAELLKQAKADQSGGSSIKDLQQDSTNDLGTEDTRNLASQQSNSRLDTQPVVRKVPSPKVTLTNAAGSVIEDDDGTGYGSYEPSFVGDKKSSVRDGRDRDDDDDDDDYGSSDREAMSSNKDAFGITAQSAKLQLEMMEQVHNALQAEQVKNPDFKLSDEIATQALNTYDTSIRSLKVLLRDLVKISKDRDAYWQYRLENEADMRRMWEDSMAQVAREQEVLEAKVGESEEKRRLTKRALKEAIESSISSHGDKRSGLGLDASGTSDKTAARSRCLGDSSVLARVVSDSDSEDDDEFFDAVDAGHVEVTPMLPATSTMQSSKTADSDHTTNSTDTLIDLTSSYQGYEDGIRQKLKMDADDRPKVSLWVRDHVHPMNDLLTVLRVFSSP